MWRRSSARRERIGKLSVAQIFKKSTAALGLARNVSLEGTISGTGATLTVHGVDATGTAADVAASGSLSVRGSTKTFSFAGSLSFRRIGNTVYINTDRTFWESLVNTVLPATPAEISLGRKLFPQVVGRWIQLTAAAGADFEYHVLGVTDPASSLASSSPPIRRASRSDRARTLPASPRWSSPPAKAEGWISQPPGRPSRCRFEERQPDAQISVTFSYPASAPPVRAPPGAKQLSQILAKIKHSG